MPQNGALLTDKDIRDQVALGHGADVVIDDPGEECITPVGYDVRAGEQAFSYRLKKRLILAQRELEILPGDTFFISSHETFQLSNRVGGLTVSRLAPQLDGLQLAALTVDPTWNGRLLIILTNQGQRPVKIRH